MTNFRFRTTMLGLAATSVAALTLGACASTPQYPVREGVIAGTGPQVPAPAYAITKSAKARPPVVDEEGYAVPPAQPTTPIERGALDSVTSEELPPPTPRPQTIAYVDPREAAAIRIFGAPEAAYEDAGLIRVADRKPAAKKKAEPAAEKKGKGKKAAPEPKSSNTKAVPGVVAGGAVVDAAGPPLVHTVKSGDTVDSIARKFGTTRKALADANDLESPYKLKPGQKIKGPQSKAKAYVVQSGDTLYAIARRFSVEASELAETNDMKVSAALRPGKKLVLPSGFKDKGVAKPPAPPKPTATKPTPPRTTQPMREPEPQPDYTTPPPAYVPPAPQPQRPPQPLVREPQEVPSTGLDVPGNPEPRPQPVRPRPQPPAPSSSDLPSRPQPYNPSGTAQPARPAPPRIVTSPAPSGPTNEGEIVALGRGRFAWPVTGDIITTFGSQGGGQRNDGINIRASNGAPVRAAADGEVVYSGKDVPGLGYVVLIKHDGGWLTAYAHMGRIDVKMRTMVTQGMQVGQVGSTGGVSEPQLHFEIRYTPSPSEKARAINPSLLLPR